MEIEKTLQLAAPPERVWALLLDPDAMGACVPGMQSIEIISPDEYSALMQVSISFITAKFRLRTRIVERREPEYLRAEGSGEDTSVASSLKQTSEMFLLAQPGGGTELRMKVKVDVLGRMGTFGLSAMKTKADRLWDQFGANLARRLEEGPGAPGSAARAAADDAAGPRPAVLPAAAAAIAPVGPEPSQEPMPAPEPEPASASASASVPLPVPTGVHVRRLEPRPVPSPMPVRSSPPGWWARVRAAAAGQPAPVIVVEVRRPDQTTVRVEWPAAQAAECTAWLREIAG